MDCNIYLLGQMEFYCTNVLTIKRGTCNTRIFTMSPTFKRDYYVLYYTSP
jgi:hypothetical protein